MTDLFASPRHQMPVDAQASSLIDETNWQILCAWCLAEQGLPFGSGSHGICPQHADQLIQAYRASRADPPADYVTGSVSPL